MMFASSGGIEPSPSFISTQVTDARRYYFDLNPDPVGELAVVCGGCERMRADYIIDRADFPFLTIEFVAEGDGTLEFDHGSYRLTPGMTFTYGPGVQHVIRSDPARPMLKYFVSIAGTMAPGLLADSSLQPGTAAQLAGFQEVHEIFELLQREGASDRRFGPKVCAALLPVLLLKIQEHASANGKPEPRAMENYRRIKRTIEQRYLALRSAEEAARACHINPSYLCRLFQRFAHTTPYRFIMRLKMNRAAELLLDRRMRVKEVAAELGFPDAFQFSHAFKRVHGISPDRFARQNDGRR